MGLKGTIKEFGLIDIIQLISQSQKSGVLKIEMEGEVKGDIYFSKGYIAEIKSATVSTMNKIGHFLVSRGKITVRELDEYLEKQKKMPVRLGRLLLDDGLITNAELKSFFRENTKEVLLRLLTMEEGKYEFDHNIIEYNYDEMDPLDVNTILIDILKDIDEVKLFRKRIKNFDYVFERKGSLKKIVVDDIANNVDEPVIVKDNVVKLYRDSSLILSYINGTNSVTDIIFRTSLSEHFVLKVLYLLMEAGEIVLAKKPIIRQNKLSKFDSRKILNFIISFVLIVAVIVILFILNGYVNKSYSGAYTIFKDKFETEYHNKISEISQLLKYIEKQSR